MDMKVYHHALHLGFSERDATRMGEDAWEEAMFMKMQYGVDESEAPLCDICGKHRAVTGVNGYGVCSEECAIEAMNKQSY